VKKVHVPLPFGAAMRRFRSAYSYFRTGVAVEGTAWLCGGEHAMAFFAGERRRAVPQHVDVELSFWNRRNERVTILEIAHARIPLYNVDLTDATWPNFDAATLEPGAKPEERSFVLVPRDDPKGRVEATVGSWLELEFRPSRGSERWARPRIRCQLGVRE
jgi:hypothetical protein